MVVTKLKTIALAAAMLVVVGRADGQGPVPREIEEREAPDALKKMHAEFERDKGGVVIGVRLHPEGGPLTDAIPHLRRLPKVIRVALYASILTPEAFLALGTMPALLEVEVYATRLGPGPGSGLFGGPCPRLAWDKLPKLRTIRLTGSGIGDEQMEDVAKAVAIRHLFVVEAGVSEKGLARLKSLKGLEMLSVQKSGVTGEGVKALAGIEGLKELTLCSNDIGRDGFRHLGTMTGLTYLNLESTMASDADTAHLALLTRLTDLDLGYNPDLTVDGLRPLADLKRLTGLRLYQTKVTDAGAAELKKALPKITVYK